MADTPPSPPISISRLLGGEVIAMCFAFILYGVTTTQGRFGDYDSIAVVDWSLAAMTFAEIFVILFVEGFYIWRIWILSNRSSTLAISLTILLVTRLGFTLSTGIFILQKGHWADLQASFTPSLSVLMTNSFSAVVDGIIAVSMIVFFRRGQSRHDDKINGALRWLMMYSVNTGAISMIISIIIAITYSTMSNDLIFGGLVILTGKLYANALLGTLNARRIMRKKMRVDSMDIGQLELPQFTTIPIIEESQSFDTRILVEL
ncbi:unnamed protein product [Somion occarium]|uniref:DUF6534 domain-containing protein n=1 Tax=Somion occarium TaxID=3059160 RepID=A0ABP1D9N5_9APHY